jgi:uncharacterized protein (DUF1800 family)
MFHLRYLILLAFLAAVASTAAFTDATSRSRSMPYRDAGLTEREAAAHLLDRFTFGPRPGQIDQVVEIGLEKWFDRQLESTQSSETLDRKLDNLETLGLTNEQILQSYPRNGRVRQQAIDEGRLDPEADQETQRRQLRAFYEESGYKPQRQLLGELIAAKVFRAVDSPNQVEEVMVDFWFNHFYVSATDNQCRRFVGTYERDAIRPYVFRSFEEMLIATAKHPAMLLYLDNAQSSAPENAVTTVSLRKEDLRRRAAHADPGYTDVLDRMDREQQRRERRMAEMPADRRPRRGINENYARELLELHTLGVDGGYTQSDVVEVARALTGWTILPEGERRERLRERINRNPVLGGELGFVIERDFFFNADWHDAGPKRILGRRFPEDGGIEEGESVLRMLAWHPSTARHIAYKLAVRFVSDTPPESFVGNLAGVFDFSDGDFQDVLWAIVQSPEFWSPDARRAKIKSPFELAASSIRGLDADLTRPGRLVQWIDKMGQPLYRYQAPTGFPDRAEMWVNAGALLHRMNFGLSLAAGKVQGVRVDLVALQNGREPESPDAALRSYASILLPERDLEETVRVLTPLVGDPDVAAQVRERSDEAKRSSPQGGDTMGGEMTTIDDTQITDPFAGIDDPPEKHPAAGGTDAAMTLKQIVGLILGSPEFQRR